MSARDFHIGAVFPQTEIGSDPIAIRDFGQAVEALGFHHLIAYDHVIGANPASRPDWKGVYTHESAFHEPLMLFSYLAAVTRSLRFMTGVVILPQRQTVLFAKQAANLDVFCNGRLRIGVGIGWNEVEYEALDAPFNRRGARLSDQIPFLRRLWTEPTFTASTAFHKITDAGINPLPIQRPIPIWIGGRTDVGMQRAARTGDGWLAIRGADQAQAIMDEFRAAVMQAGRDPESVGVENIIHLGATLRGPIREPEAAVADAELWRTAGARYVSFHTMGMNFTKPEQHIAVLRRLAELLQLEARAIPGRA